MSNRTIIEINHDYTGNIDRDPTEFARQVVDFLRNPGSEYSERLRWSLEHVFGFRVIGTAHHSDSRKVIIAGKETEL